MAVSSPHSTKIMDDSQQKNRSVFKRIYGWWLIGILVLIVALIGARLMAPYWILNYMNSRMANLPEYRGHISKVHLGIWRGAFNFYDVKVLKKTGQVPLPLFSSPEMKFSIEWAALFHGSVVLKIYIIQPKVHLVAGSSKTESQLSIDPKWISAVKNLLPFDIDYLEATDGQFHFQSPSSSPPVDVYLDQLHVVMRNLRNGHSLVAPKNRVSTFDATAVPMHQGSFKTHVNLDPFNHIPSFDGEAEMANLNILQINNLLKAYIGTEAKSGTFSVYTEFSGQNGDFNGYVKPLFKDFKVFDFERDKKNPLELVWSGILGTVASVFENKSTDEIATKITIEGKYEKLMLDPWSAIVNLLRNAFIQAITPGIDHTVVGKSGEEKVNLQAPSSTK